MKTISGKVVSSKPFSLSKAEKAITAFADVENGASDAVCEYLRRTAAAFQDLVKFHKGLKTQTSHSKGNASQPVKAETLADTGETQSQLVQNGLNYEVAEIPEEKKRKKNHGLEASRSQLVKEQNGLNNQVAEISEEKKVQKGNKNHGLKANQSQLVGKKDQNGLNNEVAGVIEQGAKGSSGKKGKKKDKNERKQNEERLNILQISDVKGKKKIEYEDAGKEIDGSVVKTGKKKRKRDDDDVLEKSLEEDVKTENVGEALDDGKLDGLNNVIDQGAKESSGKKGKKKHKKEIKQNEERLNILQSLEEEALDDGKLDGLNNEVAAVIDQGANESWGKKGKKKDKKEIKQNEDGLNNEVAAVIDQGARESSGKKGKKKDKKEIKQNEERVNILQSLENVGEFLDDGKLDGLNNEVAEVIDQGAKGSSGKKGKKRDKKEIKQNEERLNILQSLDVEGEKIEYEDAGKEINGSVVKTGKKKRKRDTDDVGEMSLEEDVKTENIGEAVNDGKHDGKKKRKKMKA